MENVIQDMPEPNSAEWWELQALRYKAELVDVTTQLRAQEGQVAQRVKDVRDNYETLQREFQTYREKAMEEIRRLRQELQTTQQALGDVTSMLGQGLARISEQLNRG